MSLTACAQDGAETSPDDKAALSADLDLQTALSLARAATNALLNLSPLSHREIVSALRDEVKLLKAMDDRSAAVAANLVAQYLPDAA